MGVFNLPRIEGPPFHDRCFIQTLGKVKFISGLSSVIY